MCSFDALCFKNPSGKVIPPDVIRKFRLSLRGKRLVSTKSLINTLDIFSILEVFYVSITDL
jgi:hypothetical protein